MFKEFLVKKGEPKMCEFDLRGLYLYVAPITGPFLEWLPQIHLAQKFVLLRDKSLDLYCIVQCQPQTFLQNIPTIMLCSLADIALEEPYINKA